MMEVTRIIGIRRDSLFSPNHIGNDRLIFDRVSANLALAGFSITIYGEQEFLEAEQPLNADLIVTMARNKLLVAKLQAYEQYGIPIINSAFGISNCYRINMVRGLISGGIPHPRSSFISTVDDITPHFELLGKNGIWIKRGDFHAIHREDVSFASSLSECRHIVNEYALRGIESAVLCEHLFGDLVKFYGVRGTGFFHWFYPYDHRHQKFTDYESINGKTEHYPFDDSALRETAERAANLLHVDIYGGDAIIDAAGNFQIIDLNDWPSFAPCRDEAAVAISSFITESVRNTV